jgi:hypothetical protein
VNKLATCKNLPKAFIRQVAASALRQKPQANFTEKLNVIAAPNLR